MKNYLVVDNWYSETEKLNVMKELDFLSTLDPIRAENYSGVAKKNNKPLIKGYRIFPHELYTFKGMEKSHIFKGLKKFQIKEFHNKVIEIFKDTNLALSEQFMGTNCSKTIINYYENNDGYNEHNDVHPFTVLIWLYKEPKKFEGGDLIFTKFNEEIKCTNNRLVLFPGFYHHKVTPITMKNEDVGFGRFAITHFFFNN
tara:strand:+ start:77 stop:673 length:597 start_codon:yes stop_codon:yes gene_type:complete